MSKIRRIDYSPDEMIAGVAGQLDPLDFGVYWMVCTLIYSRGGPIPDDPYWIARVFKSTNPRTVRASLQRLVACAKVQRMGSELMVNRCRSELERALNRTRKATENGSKGGRPSKENKDIAKPGGFSEEKLTINHQPSTINEQPSPPQSPPSGDPAPEARMGPVDRVFAHWQTVHRHPGAKLDVKRRKVIARALASYSESDLRKAISGYCNSPHHMGDNERSTVYDEITLFLRDAEHIDRGIQFFEQPPGTKSANGTDRRGPAWIVGRIRTLLSLPRHALDAALEDDPHMAAVFLEAGGPEHVASMSRDEQIKRYQEAAAGEAA